MRFAQIFGLYGAAATVFTIMGGWFNKGNIGLRIFDMEFFFYISA
jgi:hypothetical protein